LPGLPIAAEAALPYRSEIDILQAFLSGVLQDFRLRFFVV
jgi:hypothetical protein